MIPAICLFFGMMLLPESPRWLGRRDRWDEAHAVLTLVHGKGDPNSPFVVRELAEIREMVEFEKNNADVTYLELLKPHMINRTHIGVFTQIWSQLTGMNVMSKFNGIRASTLEESSANVSSVLHYLRLSHGWSHLQCQSPCFFHPIRYQRLHDSPSSALC